MLRFLSSLIFLLAICIHPLAIAETTKTALNLESLELAFINSKHSSPRYSNGRGIFVGFSAPMYITEYGITSLALDGGYGNVGTIDGENELGDPYSLHMTIVQLGLRGSAMLTSTLSGYVKVNAARINSDSTEVGKDISYEGQLAAGFEWHLPKGLGLSLTYTQVTSEVSSVMLGMSLR